MRVEEYSIQNPKPLTIRDAGVETGQKSFDT